MNTYLVIVQGPHHTEHVHIKADKLDWASSDVVFSSESGAVVAVIPRPTLLAVIDQRNVVN